MEAPKRRGPKPRDVTDPVCIAVRQLREALGETQQQFAYRMNTAIRTIARWETVRPPKDYPTLTSLAHLALRVHRRDLLEAFLSAPEASFVVTELLGLFRSSPPKVTGYRLWDRAIADAVKILHGPQAHESGEVYEAFEDFSREIEAIKRRIDAASEKPDALEVAGSATEEEHAAFRRAALAVAAGTNPQQLASLSRIAQGPADDSDSKDFARFRNILRRLALRYSAEEFARFVSPDAFVRYLTPAEFDAYFSPQNSSSEPSETETPERLK